jgi:LysM repeat protein
MNRSKPLLLVCFLMLSGIVAAQRNEGVYEYINTYKQLAIDEMIRSGVPASIKLAQGIHETEAGKSDLVTRSNNHFGIKCKTGWQGEKVYHDDDARGECFRSYSSADESYMDHSNFLKNGQRYAFLFEIDPTDYKAWAYGLKKAGYATNVKYSQILIKLIEDYNLQQYSLIALGRIPPADEILAGNNKVVLGSRNNELSSGPAETIIEEEPEAVNFPEGTFEINRAKVVYAKAGTSLLALAEKNNISVHRLIDFNEMEQEDVLIKGQLIFLQRKRRQGATDIHFAKQGETMYDIAQAEGIRLENLLKFNGLAAHQKPAAGEKVYLQNEAPQKPLLAETLTIPTVVAKGEPVVKLDKIRHVVQPKETLYGIARYYNTTVDKIKEWNNLGNDQLKKGQELVIYKN